MMRRISIPAELRLIAILLAALLALSAGCASNNAPTEDATPPTDTEFSDGMGDRAGEMEEVVVEVVDVEIPAIYFDLDSTEIRREFRGALEAGAMALKDSGATIVIEGHCDERGSEEYNFALGERRAGAVRKYLFNLGVPMGQMTVISYGEAQPAVAGRGESAWSKNRRAEFRSR